MSRFVEGGSVFRTIEQTDTVNACSSSCALDFHAQFDLNSHRHDRHRFRLSRSSPAGGPTTRSPPFASVTSVAWGALRDFGLRRGGVNGIDQDPVTVLDLEAYAQSQGLPSTYVSQFLSYALKASATAVVAAVRDRQQQQQVLQQLPTSGSPLPVDLDAFRGFVNTREKALKRAFGMFDKDKHGSISSGDLEAALRHVTMCCPKSRCMYQRSKRCQAARQLILQATEGGSRPVPYPEFRNLFLQLPASDVMVQYWLAAGCVPDLDGRVGHNSTTGTTQAKPWGHLFAGAVAGAASRTATAPLEVLRLSAMAGNLSSPNLMVAAQDIVTSEGWKGLYKGNAVNVMRAAPQKALDFFAFDMFKRLLGGAAVAEGGVPTGLQTFMAAGLAGVSSCVALYPLEVVRSRVTVAKGAMTMSVAATLMHIARSEGPLALYKGLLPSVAAIFPEAAITYGLHDLLKRSYRSCHHGKEPGVLPSLTLGVASAFTGQLVSFPLEAVSRRLQLAHGGAGGVEGARQMVVQMLTEGGPKALYRGVGAATLRLIPMAITSFGTYELVRAVLLHLEERQDRQEADREYGLLHLAGGPSSCVRMEVTPLQVTPLLAAAMIAAPDTVVPVTPPPMNS